MLQLSNRFNHSLSERLTALLSISRSAPHPANGMRLLTEVASQTLPSSFRQSLRCLARSESLQGAANHLVVQPFDWFLPTETQMVFAFADQLSHRDKRTELERVNALFAAVAAGSLLDNRSSLIAPPKLSEVGEVAVEKTTRRGKRIDLFIAGACSGRPIEALIEFKLGHSITPGQLESYTADERGCASEDTVLVVSAPRLTRSDAIHIRAANRKRPANSHWRFIDFRHLLMEYACSLSDEYDDEEFARVRRSLQTLTESWF